MDKIILIGGSPTVGKTYAAKKLARSLKLPWLSTDAIRMQMRKIVRPKDYPELFRFAGATSALAVTYLSKHSANEIVRHQNAESREVWKGVRGLLESSDCGSIIIEGVAILPRLVKFLALKNKTVKAVFLVDENTQRVRQTVYRRGLWGKASEYSDSVKEREVAWVMAFNRYLLSEAKKYRLPVVNITDRGKYLAQIRKLIS